MKKKEKVLSLLIEYPNCSTCQKAKVWLIENRIEFDARNIFDSNPTEEELEKWIPESGIDIDKWFNTTGISYRRLNLKEKLKAMSYEEKIKLLASDGMLIKRPVLITEKGIFAGFKKDEWEKIL